MIDEKYIVKKLNLLFHNGEFDSNRVFMRKLRERTSFFTANIIAILNKCYLHDSQLIKNIKESKLELKKYQQGHFAYHWPLKNGKSIISNSLLLGQINFLALCPDADCTCVVQIALQNSLIIDDIIDELTYYRADRKNFILPGFQKDIPETQNTFLTWFPPKEGNQRSKMETIDVTVDSNILWFLGEHEKLDIPGAMETIEFIKKVLSEDLILTKTFEISPYYPYPLVILFHLSRAIHWGKLSDLYSAESKIISLTKQVMPKSSFDHLLIASIGYFFKNSELIKSNLPEVLKRGIHESPIYVSPLLFPVVQHFNGGIGLAKYGFTHIKFSSESFQWAILLWLIQGVKRDGLLS